MGSPIKMLIEALGENTTLGEIIRLVEVAGQNKSYYIKIADKIAQYFTPIIILLGISTFLWWRIWLSAPITESLNHAVALIIVTCPCALGLAVPAVMVASSSFLMRHGIMLKTSDALEKLAQIQTIVFDKTGTLTEGEPQCCNIDTLSLLEKAIAYSLASASKHPLSQALCKAIAHQDLPVAVVSEISETSGGGVSGWMDGGKVAIGSRSFCGINGALSDNADITAQSLLEIWFVRDGQQPKCLYFLDTLKSDAHEVVDDMKNTYGLSIMIVSGDQPHIVSKIADTLGITEWYAEKKPIEKYTIVNQLNSKSLMVGDGLNDAAALEASFVSMSPTSSLEIAQVRSDIVFHGRKLTPILLTYNRALLARKLVNQNFLLSFGYNIISIPLAMLGLLNPIIAAIMMSSSSIIVMLNALRATRE